MKCLLGMVKRLFLLIAGIIWAIIYGIGYMICGLFLLLFLTPFGWFGLFIVFIIGWLVQFLIDAVRYIITGREIEYELPDDW